MGLNATVKGGGAGLGGKVKGEGAERGQDTRDTNAGYSYPLVGPRLEEAHNDGTVVQSTGAERSLAPTHVMMINPSYSQHMTGRARQGDEGDDDQDADGPGVRQDN